MIDRRRGQCRRAADDHHPHARFAAVSPDCAYRVRDARPALHRRDDGAGRIRLASPPQTAISSSPGPCRATAPGSPSSLGTMRARRNPHGRVRRSNPRTITQIPAITAARASRPTAHHLHEVSGGGGITSNRVGGTALPRFLPPGRRHGIVADGGNPQFGTASDRFFLEVTSIKAQSISVDLTAAATAHHAQGEMVTGHEVRPTAALWPSPRITFSSRPSSAPRGCWRCRPRARKCRSPAVSTAAQLSGLGGQPSPGAWGRRSTAPIASGSASQCSGHAYSPPTTGTTLAITVASGYAAGWTLWSGARWSPWPCASGSIEDASS